MATMMAVSSSVVLDSIKVDAAIAVAYGVPGRASRTPMLPPNADAQPSLITALVGPPTAISWQSDLLSVT